MLPLSTLRPNYPGHPSRCTALRRLPPAPVLPPHHVPPANPALSCRRRRRAGTGRLAGRTGGHGGRCAAPGCGSCWHLLRAVDGDCVEFGAAFGLVLLPRRDKLAVVLVHVG